MKRFHPEIQAPENFSYQLTENGFQITILTRNIPMLIIQGVLLCGAIAGIAAGKIFAITWFIVPSSILAVLSVYFAYTNLTGRIVVTLHNDMLSICQQENEEKKCIILDITQIREIDIQNRTTAGPSASRAIKDLVVYQESKDTVSFGTSIRNETKSYLKYFINQYITYKRDEKHSFSF